MEQWRTEAIDRAQMVAGELVELLDTGAARAHAVHLAWEHGDITGAVRGLVEWRAAARDLLAAIQGPNPVEVTPDTSVYATGREP